MPPKYNQYGNRQLWVIETESGVDEIVNGILFSFIAFSPLWISWGLLEAGVVS